MRAVVGGGARQGLLDALSLCGRVAAQRSPTPILGCVLLKAAPGGGLWLAATDLDGRVEATVAGVEVEAGGAAAVALPHRYFAELIRQLPADEEIVLEAGPSGAEVRCAGSRHRVAGADPDAFPAGPPGGAAEARIPAQALREAGRQVAVCASDDIARPALTGVLFEAGDEGLVLVATDGTRIAVKRVRAEAAEAAALVPARAVAAVASAVGGDGDVAVSLADSHARFEWEPAWGRAVLAARLLAAAFPDWRLVARVDARARVEVSRDGFLAALQRAALPVSLDSGIPAVRLELGPGGLAVTSRSASAGEAREEVPGAAVEGGPMEVPFNADLLRDGLKALPGEAAVLELSGPRGLAALHGGDPSEYCYFALPLAD